MIIGSDLNSFLAMVECLIGGQVGFGAYTDADETFCAGMTKTIFN